MKEHSVHEVWIGLGSNLGERHLNLDRAKEMMISLGCSIRCSSAIYESDPWGYTSDNSFYNQCIVIETDLNPGDLLLAIKGMETSIGRIQSDHGYEDRKIDIDILFFDDLVLDSDHLKIPHPGIPKRNFVLSPLLEITPAKMHPILKKTVAELAGLCEDRGKVYRLSHK